MALFAAKWPEFAIFPLLSHISKIQECFRTEKDVPKQKRMFQNRIGSSKTGKDVLKQIGCS